MQKEEDEKRERITGEDRNRFFHDMGFLNGTFDRDLGGINLSQYEELLNISFQAYLNDQAGESRPSLKVEGMISLNSAEPCWRLAKIIGIPCSLFCSDEGRGLKSGRIKDTMIHNSFF